MKASFNQRYAIKELADKWDYRQIADMWEQKDLSELTVERYKRIRNAICFNNPSYALEQLSKYPDRKEGDN